MSWITNVLFFKTWQGKLYFFKKTVILSGVPREVYSLVANKGCDENRTIALAPESNSRTDQMHSVKVGSFCFGYKKSKSEREFQPKIPCFTSHVRITSHESWMTLGLPAKTPFWCIRMNIQVEMKWAMRGTWHNFWLHCNTFYSGVSNLDVNTESWDERQEKCKNMPCSPHSSPWSPFLPVTKWRKTLWDRKDHPLMGCNALVHLGCKLKM